MNRRLLLLVLAATVMAQAQAPAGRWDGTITMNNVKIPFTIFFDGAGDAIRGSFVNGDVRVTSTSGSFEGGTLRLSFDQCGAKLEASLANGELKGTYGGYMHGGTHPFTASAYCTCAFQGEAGPEIMGAWELTDLKWPVLISRKGEDTFATILRGGDRLGPFSGRFDGLSFTLHYFDGSRGAVLEIDPRKDGSFDALWNSPGESARKVKLVRKTPGK